MCGVIDDIGDAASSVGDAVGDAASAVAGAVGDAASAVGGAVGDAASAVGGAISDGANAVAGAAGDVANALGGAATTVVHGVEDGAEALGHVIADHGTAIINGLETAGTAALAATGIGAPLAALITAGVATGTDIAEGKGVGDSIVDGVAGAANQFVPGAGQAIHTAVSGVENGDSFGKIVHDEGLDGTSALGGPLGKIAPVIQDAAHGDLGGAAQTALTGVANDAIGVGTDHNNFLGQIGIIGANDAADGKSLTQFGLDAAKAFADQAAGGAGGPTAQAAHTILDDLGQGKSLADIGQDVLHQAAQEAGRVEAVAPGTFSGIVSDSGVPGANYIGALLGDPADGKGLGNGLADTGNPGSPGTAAKDGLGQLVGHVPSPVPVEQTVQAESGFDRQTDASGHTSVPDSIVHPAGSSDLGEDGGSFRDPADSILDTLGRPLIIHPHGPALQTVDSVTPSFASHSIVGSDPATDGSGGLGHDVGHVGGFWDQAAAEVGAGLPVPVHSGIDLSSLHLGTGAVNPSGLEVHSFTPAWTSELPHALDTGVAHVGIPAAHHLDPAPASDITHTLPEVHHEFHALMH